MYVQRNTESRSCNNFCREKAISITYSECAFVALVTQHVMCTRHIIIRGLAAFTIFFHFISYRLELKSYWTQNVFWFPLQICLKYFSF
jgi:hypothetical protein